MMLDYLFSRVRFLVCFSRVMQDHFAQICENIWKQIVIASYLHSSLIEVIKVKGIYLNLPNPQIFHFDFLRKGVLWKFKCVSIVEENHFARRKYTELVYKTLDVKNNKITSSQTKTWKWSILFHTF